MEKKNMTQDNKITEDDKIQLLANPNWIKYIQCKKCKQNYYHEIAENPCVKCGEHDFEQFDLILYPMTLEAKQKHYDGQKALEQIEKIKQCMKSWHYITFGGKRVGTVKLVEEIENIIGVIT